MPAPYDIYASELLKKEWGFPLWHADPYGLPKVEIGDIGYVERGKFLKVDKILLEQVLGNRFQDQILITRLRTDEPIHSKSVRRVPIDTQNDDLHPIFVPQLGAAAGIAFQCSTKFGAVLNCREPFVTTSNLKIHARNTLKKYLESQFPEIQREYKTPLVCVTGVVMTRDWEAAVFCSSENQLSSKGTPLRKWLSAELAEGRSIEKSGGHYHPIENSRDREIECRPPKGPCYKDGSLPEQNQCIFFRGYRFQERRSMIPRVLKATAEPMDDDVSDDGSTLIPPWSIPSLNTIFDETPQLSDPYRVVADEMLQETDKEFVLVHDDDVIDYFRRESIAEKEMNRFSGQMYLKKGSENYHLIKELNRHETAIQDCIYEGDPNLNKAAGQTPLLQTPSSTILPNTNAPLVTTSTLMKEHSSTESQPLEIRTYILTAEKALAHIASKGHDIARVMSQHQLAEADYQITVGFNESVASSGLGHLEEIYLTVHCPEELSCTQLSEELGRIFSPFPGHIFTRSTSYRTPVFDADGTLYSFEDLSRLQSERLMATQGYFGDGIGSTAYASAVSFKTENDVTLHEQHDASGGEPSTTKESKGKGHTPSNPNSPRKRPRTNRRDDSTDEEEADDFPHSSDPEGDPDSGNASHKQAVVSFQVSTCIFTTILEPRSSDTSSQALQKLQIDICPPPLTPNEDLSLASPSGPPSASGSSLGSLQTLFQKLQANGKIMVKSDRSGQPLSCRVMFKALNFQSTEAPPEDGYLHYHARIDIDSGSQSASIENKGPRQTRESEDLFQSTQSRKATRTVTSAMTATLSLFHIATSSSVGGSVSRAAAKETSSAIQTTRHALQIRESQDNGIMSWKFHVADPHDQADGLKLSTSTDSVGNDLPKVKFEYFAEQPLGPHPIKSAISSYWKLPSFKSRSSRYTTPYENLCITTVIHLPIELSVSSHHNSTTDVQCAATQMGSGALATSVNMTRIQATPASPPVDGAVTGLRPYDHEKNPRTVFIGIPLVTTEFSRNSVADTSSSSVTRDSLPTFGSQVAETSQSSIQSDIEDEIILVPHTNLKRKRQS